MPSSSALETQSASACFRFRFSLLAQLALCLEILPMVSGCLNFDVSNGPGEFNHERERAPLFQALVFLPPQATRSYLPLVVGSTYDSSLGPNLYGCRLLAKEC